jgi:3-carboxy-cis,cis-muconate cycloisomerase
MLAAFNDERTIAHALAFEAALARAQASARLIAPELADAIVAAVETLNIEPGELAAEAAHAGTLAIPLVTCLRASLEGDPAAAQAVHRGATSQDLADTVLMLQCREAAGLLNADLQRICHALADLAERHATTPAIGRTLLQDALPVTVGLRAAQWLAAVDGAQEEFKKAASQHIKLQFGGPVGTRAGLEGKGPEVARRLGKLLDLPTPAAPWHSNRGGIAVLASAVAIVIGAIGKIGRDISLLSQNAVSELREPASPGRGGSSAMPHKRNPTGCQVALSAALRAPGLVAGILAGLPQELERGLGGWQAEAPALTDLFLLAGGSAETIAAVLEALEVDSAAMARNLAVANLGSETGEAEVIVAAILAEYREED